MQNRPLFTIAREIKATWKKPYFGAVPYLDAMLGLNRIEDKFFFDSAQSVVQYFLANAGTWRGDDAKRIKAEFKSML